MPRPGNRYTTLQFHRLFTLTMAHQDRDHLDAGSVNIHQNVVVPMLFSHHLLILAKVAMCAVQPCSCHV